ncbi:hypothetical protein [Paenibacillus wulumuqiensis]|uniref:hypothetical protein n=1 Tax=Paenibacillus wulumuqiensis TaxID=1567107 RepID=UPI00069615BD|nr:hypothetical protein [Paenibacillus wulumuqiensis]
MPNTNNSEQNMQETEEQAAFPAAVQPVIIHWPHDIEVQLFSTENNDMQETRHSTAEQIVNSAQSLTFHFDLTESRDVVLNLTAVSDSHWQRENRESTALRIYVNGEYNQDLILFYGDRAFMYQRLLGQLEAGTYEVTLHYALELSRPLAGDITIQHIAIGGVDPRMPVYRYTPVVYGRQLQHPYESTFTDTPLVLMYWMKEEADRTIIEYHMVFSHEDEGTPSGLLMSKWGRTTDIEWMYRVELDPEGNLLRHSYQGPHHIETEFKGEYGCGGHPVLQAATANGNFTDTPVSDYCYMLPPLYRWDPESEPREQVMLVYPFTHQVSNWEMNRQYTLEQPARTDSWQLADQRGYLFISSTKYAVEHSTNAEPNQLDERVHRSSMEKSMQLQQTCIDYQVRLHGEEEWLSSSYGDMRIGDFRAAYQGPYHQFSTTIKLGEQVQLEHIAAIRAVLLPGGLDRIVVEGVYAYMLNDQYLPQEGIRSTARIELSTNSPSGLLWTCAENELHQPSPRDIAQQGDVPGGSKENIHL